MYRHILAAAPQKCNVDSNKQKKRTNNKLSDDFFSCYFLCFSWWIFSQVDPHIGNGRTHTRARARRWLLTIGIIRNELDGTQVSLSVDWMDAAAAETRVAVATRNDSDIDTVTGSGVRSRLCISSSIFRSRITRESRYTISLHGSQLNAAFVLTVMRYLNKATTEMGPHRTIFHSETIDTTHEKWISVTDAHSARRMCLGWPRRPWTENSRRCSTSCSSVVERWKMMMERECVHNSHGFVRCNVSKMPAWRWLILFRALNEVANDT